MPRRAKKRWRDAPTCSPPYFVTYLNEYAHGTTPVFGHTWWLGLEEKSCLVWPFLAFAGLKRSGFRLALASGLAGAIWVAGNWLGEPLVFCRSYWALLVDCALAIVMHNRKGFELLRLLGSQLAHTAIFLGAVAFTLASWRT